MKIKNLKKEEEIILGIKKKSFGGFRIHNKAQTVIIPKINLDNESNNIILFFKI